MGRRRVTGSTVDDTGGTLTVPVASIAHNPRNPRPPETYDAVGELAESIRAAGLLQSLALVRYELFLTQYPQHEHEIGSHDWVVMDGNRRLAAVRLLGWSDVPYYVVDRLGRDGMLDEAAIIANVHREDLPPLREAEALRLLVERHGSQAEVARRIGKTKGFVSQRLALLDLPADRQAAIRDGSLTVADARRAELRRAGRDLSRAAADPAATSERNAASDYAVNGGTRRAGRPRKPRDPAEVAAKLRRELTAEELAEVARLISEVQ